MLERKNPLNKKKSDRKHTSQIRPSRKRQSGLEDKVKKILHWSTVKKKVNKHDCNYYIPVCGHRDQTSDPRAGKKELKQKLKTQYFNEITGHGGIHL